MNICVYSNVTLLFALRRPVAVVDYVFKYVTG